MIDEVVRHPTAKRIRLSVDPATGTARLVVPKRAPLKTALAWAEEKKDWIADQRARLPEPRPFRPRRADPVRRHGADIGLGAWQPPGDPVRA
nr:YgjP-like metallopeptidase domain-containing protein [Sphingomonas sp. SORGH_AS_0742]